MKNLIVMKRNHFATDIGMRYGLALIAALFLAPFWALGQTDYSGTYYIASDWQTPNTTNRNYDATTLTNNYYLCPTDGWIYYKPDNDWSDDGVEYPNPFLTTFKCRTSDYNTYGGINNAKWIITKHGNKYAFYHTGTGKYMLFSGQINGCGVDRMRVHLETVTGNLPDNALFSITEDGRSVLIKPTSDHLTVNGGNKDALTGQPGKEGGPDGYKYTAGIIGIYRNNDDNKYFYLEDYITRPTISLNVSGLIEITAPEGIIHYTTDGSAPDANSTEYTGPFALQEGENLIKAVTIVSNEVSNVASITFYKTATPTMTLIYEGDGKVSLSCSTEGANIYYEIGNSSSIPNPTVGSTPYEGLIENAAGKYIKAIAVKEDWINSYVLETGVIAFACATPVIRKTSPTTFTITCGFPTSGANIRYTMGVDPADPTPTSGNQYIGPVSFQAPLPFTVKAIAYANNYDNSAVATKVLTDDLPLDEDGYYIIASHDDFEKFVTMVNESEDNASAKYKITDDINVSGVDIIELFPFAGELKSVTKADGTFPVLSGLSHAIFNTIDGGTVKNVILDNVSISGNGNVGAICNEATGASRIYNCGILPNDPNLTATSSIKSNDGYCGGLVGLLDGSSRVINCFSFANITGGTTVAGIVGYNNTSGATQSNYTEKTIVMNCMFYGEISGGTTKYPVYGGNVIANDGATAINNYNYYRGEATFDDDYSEVANYNRSWPAEERNLRRFEYYRSILNSNRRLCTWWVSGADNTVPTDDDVASVGIAKWVLDRSIAPYPVLKAWGKYPSVINPNPKRVWDTIGNQWVQRTNAAPYQGKNLGTLNVTIKSGAHPGTLDGLSEKSKSRTLVITDMDTLNHDFGYAKVQLPYYNEVFGDSLSNNHLTRYYGNYTDKVVTGWKIISVNDNDLDSGYTFNANWESGCNFADRTDKYKDLCAKSGRVFAQGGYYYVPEDVTSITIEAYWGTAIYMHGKGRSLDRVSVCSYEGTTKNYGYAFAPAGTLSDTWVYNNMPIYDDLDDVVKNRLSTSSSTVYDQAVVLVGNFQVQARNDIDLNYTNGKKVTFMSADLDFDNEPDFCWQFQWRGNTDRRRILPVRFDFLPIPELGLAIRHNKYAYAIGIFVPNGHFEMTETAFMYTTQFEYMMVGNPNHQQPLILNGGQFEQIVAKGGTNLPQVANTRNIILGGNVWMKRFTPGSHTGNSHKCIARHCAVSVMGGEYPEFYLSGLYRKDIDTTNAYNDNPHCYTNGGRFGLIAGAGNEAVKNSVYFEIDHSIIGEFYGGGINANNPVARSVNVVINNSLVNKYCGGPRIGTCKTVITEAKGTVFNYYFGGGNGGTNLYRDEIYDNNVNDMPSDFSGSTYGWSGFNPISTQGATATYSADYGYHAEFEFEVFNQSNGINNEAVVRTYRHWAQFGKTSTLNVSNTLDDCTVKNNFYGGGNLGNVNGNVTTTLTNCNIIGNAYGGGFSASIPSFPVHDKNKVSFPKRDAAGVCHNGSVGYRTDEENNIIKYTWCYKNPETNVVLPSGVVIPSGVSTSKPAFQYDGKWYCYTTETLENLGAISGNTSITVEGNTSIQGHVFGAGDASKVMGDTFVHIKERAKVLGNVYGGGNMGEVGGNTKVVVNGQSNNNGQGTGSGNNPNND